MNPDKVDGSLRGDKLKSWLGRQQVRVDEVSPAPVRAMSAMLDRQAPEELEKSPLPALWHWLGYYDGQSTCNDMLNPKRILNRFNELFLASSGPLFCIL